VRAQRFDPGLQLSASLWQLDIGSDLVCSGGAGTTEPSLHAVELAAYHASPEGSMAGLIVDADAAFSRARFRDHEDIGDVARGRALEFPGSSRLRSGSSP